MRPDPRIKDDICGVTEIRGNGIEFICINKPHDKDYIRRTGKNRGRPIPSSSPAVHRHYMVNRWPYREQAAS